MLTIMTTKSNEEVKKLLIEKKTELQNSFRTGLGLKNLINRYKNNSKKSTNHYMSILKELDKLKAYKSLFSTNNQAEINNMRKQIENLLMFKNTWAKYYNLNAGEYGGNKEVFRKRVKNKYPHNRSAILNDEDISIGYFNQDNYSNANFTNIYMDPNEWIPLVRSDYPSSNSNSNNNNYAKRFTNQPWTPPIPGNMLSTRRKYYFNHEHKLQKLFNPEKKPIIIRKRKYYPLKIPYEYSRFTKSIETKLQEKLADVYMQLVYKDKYINFNRISVKENDNLIIRLFGSPLSSNYKYFIEQNKNKNTLTYSVKNPNNPTAKVNNVRSLLFTVRNTNSNNSKVKSSIPIKLINNGNKYQFELLNKSYKNKLNQFKVYR